MTISCYLGTIWGVTAAARACVVQRVVRVTLMTEKNNMEPQAPSIDVCVCVPWVCGPHARTSATIDVCRERDVGNTRKIEKRRVVGQRQSRERHGATDRHT